MTLDTSADGCDWDKLTPNMYIEKAWYARYSQTMNMILSVCAVCIGACAGALLRWLANTVLNPVLAALPLGTLAVNWLGSLLMGLALGLFAFFPGAASQLKLLVITGFLGSLTTFSAFAGEMAAMLQQGRIALCAGVICLHVIGSIVLVFLGLGLAHLIRSLCCLS